MLRPAPFAVAALLFSLGCKSAPEETPERRHCRSACTDARAACARSCAADGPHVCDKRCDDQNLRCIDQCDREQATP